jgi:hypothetical protein
MHQSKQICGQAGEQKTANGKNTTNSLNGETN